MKKFVIWQNYDTEDEEREYREYYHESYPDEEPTEQEMYYMFDQYHWELFEDEQRNLSMELPTEIIVLADIGRWNGRRYDYKELNSCNLADCLDFQRDCSYGEWFVDEHKNLRSNQSHHDGTNHLLYRRWKDGISDEQRGNFLDKVYYGKATSKDIMRYTVSLGKEVAKVYGW